MAWISSKEFAEKYNLNRDTIVKSTSRADKKGKNFCSISIKFSKKI